MKVECDKWFDSVELVMRLEDCFGISIPDKEAERLKTVGDLFDYMRQEVSTNASAECLTAKAFYRVRRSLMAVTGWPRRSIRPDTLLDDVLPKEDRRQKWGEMRTHSDLDLPRLIRHWRVWLPIFQAGGALFVLGILASRFSTWSSLAMFLLVPIVVAAAIRLTRGMAVVIPGCATVGDLARCVWTVESRLPAENGASDSQIWEAIVNVISQNLGLNPSKITRDLRFLDIMGP